MHRGISPKVLRYCVGSGILYQTARGSYRNCVFVGKDGNGVPRSAFQRGCQGSFSGDVAGSQKQYGFLIPAESENCDTVEIYEAPLMLCPAQRCGSTNTIPRGAASTTWRWAG